MDVCEESETFLENTENQKIEATEETAPTLHCSDEKSERSHVCCLLGVSDLTLEEDGRASECAISTGWEEAVHGWGRTSPTACIWSKKKVKRGRAREGTNGGNDCLFCMSLSQGSLESRSLLEVGKLEAGAEAEVSTQKSWSSEKNWSGLSQGPGTASREQSNKLCIPTDVHGEKKSLQLKEFIWCMEEWPVPETVSSKAGRNPSGSPEQGLSTPDSLAAKALVVLPPLKSSPHNLDVLSKKSRNIFWQPEEKVLRVEKDDCMACADGLKGVDGKGEKRHFELASHVKVTNVLPFPPTVARTHLLSAESQRCCLHWSLLPQKSTVFPPNPTDIRYLATLQVLGQQGKQSCRTRLKTKDTKPPRTTAKHIITEAKQQNRPHVLESKIFPKPLLPSLTVSRVVIPVSTHRVL
uniref:RIKEN cDNA 1700030J22 gene n=1 Tax=Mus spicilegus TaxID=10103 RepID=A0A8C6HR70_MUSSI